MHVHDDLELLRHHLSRLAATTTLGSGLRAHTLSVVALVDHVLGRLGTQPYEVLAEVRQQVWAAHQHLSGAVSKEAPFEVVFALSNALLDWSPPHGPAPLITTALIDEPNFYFSQSLQWKRVAALFPDFPRPEPGHALVQVSLPRLYRTRPLDCVPLYHELAHYVDHVYRVTEGVLLVSSLGNGKPPVELHTIYMREHFADLFAACYCGDAVKVSIARMSSSERPTSTHPPQHTRFEVIDSFLAARPHKVVADFNGSLLRRGLPELKPRFGAVDVGPAFDDLRPCELADVGMLHGVFGSARRYLDDVLETPRAPWAVMPRHQIVRIVNDLVEKSIRNMDVRERWKRASAGP